MVPKITGFRVKAIFVIAITLQLVFLAAQLILSYPLFESIIWTSIAGPMTVTTSGLAVFAAVAARNIYRLIGKTIN